MSDITDQLGDVIDELRDKLRRSNENVIRLESERAELLRIIQLNHKYHQEGDDSARYSDSEVCAENHAALLMAMANDEKNKVRASPSIESFMRASGDWKP